MLKIDSIESVKKLNPDSYFATMVNDPSINFVPYHMDSDDVTELLKEGVDPIDVILTKHPDDICVVKMDITKELAQKWIDNRINKQRNANTANVNKLMKMINDNEWFVIPNGLGFNTEGDLNDGQHRMLALLGSEKEFITIMVLTNLDPDSIKAIDGGKVRNLRDQVKVATGTDPGGVLVTITNSVFGYGYGVIDDFNSIPDASVWLNKFNVLGHADAFKWIMGIYNSINKKGKEKTFPYLYSTAVRGYLWAKHEIKGKAERKEFVHRIEQFVYICIDAISDWMIQGKGEMPSPKKEGEQWAWKTQRYVKDCKINNDMGGGQMIRREVCLKMNRSLYNYMNRIEFIDTVGRGSGNNKGSRILKSPTEYFPLPEEKQGLKKRVARRREMEKKNILAKEKKYSN